MKRRIAALLAICVLGTSFAATAGDAGHDAPQVRDAWARATPPGAAVAAAYLTLVGGANDDRLVGARTDVAAMTQIHVVTQADGVARMRETDAVTVPAHTTVVLAPSDRHLMLMDLRRPLVAGQPFDLTLEFEHAGARVVRVAVLAPDQAPAR